MGCLSIKVLPHNIKLAGNQLYIWVERNTDESKVSCPRTQLPPTQPQLDFGIPDPESRALWLPLLHYYYTFTNHLLLIHSCFISHYVPWQLVPMLMYSFLLYLHGTFPLCTDVPRVGHVLCSQNSFCLKWLMEPSSLLKSKDNHNNNIYNYCTITIN